SGLSIATGSTAPPEQCDAATPETTPAPPSPTAALAAVANPPPPAPDYAARLRTQTAQVLAGPDFRQRETLRYPVLRDWLRKWLHRGDSKPAPAAGPDLRLLATVFQYLAAALLVLALGWLLWRGWQWLAPQVARRAPRARGRIAEAQHLALSDTPLPDSVAAAAAAAWHAGDAALALSLLYRGAVRGLARDHGIELPDSATEGECLRQAQRGSAPVIRAAFSPIVKAWMAQAYADCPPDDFAALVALYEVHFEPPGGATR
ncbi:MAG TPA: DUF4129 domain-containing protein, partial [Moraxellaceae bacterium]|nr:DUF4129 domain-containing protein [Moraxellaceae bacterium]